MQTYKATNGLNTYINNFESLEAAKAYYLPIIGNEYTITLASESEQIPPKTPEQKVIEGIEFGKALYLQFLTDNQTLAENGVGTFSPALAVAMLDAFRYIKELLLAGSIIQARQLLSAVQTDPAIFTQERKDSYLAQMDSFLNNQ